MTVLLFATLLLAPLLPAAAKASQRAPVPAKRTLTAAKRPVAKRPAAVRTKTLRAPAPRYAFRGRLPAYRYSSRSRVRQPYRIVTHFRPVLAVNSSDMPELASPLGNLAPRELQDSFYYRRPDGIIHYAIDIFRPIGEPLFAAVDGTIERLDPNPLGGNVVYIVDEERRFRFYYAHLSSHAPGLVAGMPIKRGELIGYVGDTGNAKGTQPHLHFQICNLAGSLVNPYPLLLDLARREDTLLSE